MVQGWAVEWHDQGIVLSARRHGESAVVLQLLTRAHGRHAGLVRGGQGRRARGVLQPGNRVAATCGHGSPTIWGATPASWR